MYLTYNLNLNLCEETYNSRASLSSAISRITIAAAGGGGVGVWVQVLVLIEKATNKA
jgi:hypothetical protein